MISALLRRLTLGTRSLDAGGGGRRWNKAPSLAAINAEIGASGVTIARRARYYARNNALIAAAVAALDANIVGTGIKPRSRHPSEAVRKAIHARFTAWSDTADLSGVTDWPGLQSLVCRSMIEAGEAFVRLIALPAGGTVPFRLQVVDAEQVPMDLTRDLEGGGRIVSGVEFDALGQRVAYHLWPQRPGEAWPIALTPTRVPASEVLHVFRPLQPGQVRGLSWLAPTLLKINELDQLADAQLVKAKVAAMLAGFIIDGEGKDGGYTTSEPSLEPGTMRVLAPGSDVKFSQPPDLGQAYAPFLKSELHAAAAGLGATYEQMTGDMSEANYSSARVALIEQRRRIEAIQHSVLVFQLCRPVWNRFIELAVLSGQLDAPDFFDDPAPYYAAAWYPPGWGWVDPLKDAQAEIVAIAAGLKSRSEAIAERGYDAEEVDAQIAADRAREQALGLGFTMTSSRKTEAPPA